MASAAATSIHHFVLAGVAPAGHASVSSTSRSYHLSSSWKGTSILRFGSRTTVSDARDRLSISAVIEKPVDSSSDFDPERVVLERMYLTSPEIGGKTEELVGSEALVNGTDASEGWRKKEQELNSPETQAKSDDRDTQNAKAAFLQGKKELEAAHTIQRVRREEVNRQQKQLTQQAKELKDAKRTLREQQRRIQILQEQVSEKQAELTRSKSSISEKDENLLGMKKLLKVKDSQLQFANLTISQQSLEVDQLKTCLKEKENELRRSEEERFLKQEQLSRTESELEKQVMTYLDAKEELKSLKQELVRYKASDVAAKQDLERANSLLNEFRSKLEVSQKIVAQLRGEIKEQGLQLKHQREEISSQQSALASHVLKLKEVMSESEKQNEEIRLVKISCKALEAEVKQEKDRVLELQKIIDQKKASLHDSALEAKSLKCDIQQLESRLSDTQISLQLKEAELVTAKLEIHQLKSDLDSLRSALAEKDHDLQITTKVVSALQMEVGQLKYGLKNEQEKHAKANARLRDKEDQLEEVKLNLEATKGKVLEATSVVWEIAEFAKILAECSNERQSVSYESSVLMETNQQLFAANRALLERELQFQNLWEKSSQDVKKQKELEEEMQLLKRNLEEKHMELDAVNKALAGKEQQLTDIWRKWDEREEELVKLRNEIKEESKSLVNLHLLYERQHERVEEGGDRTSQEAEIELRLAKQQFEMAVSSMRQLVQLSHELVEETNMNSSASSASDYQLAVSSPLAINTVHSQSELRSVTSASLNDARNVGNNGVSSYDDMKQKSVEQDEALENTKQALSKLMKLTERLVADAVIDVGWQTANGYFTSNMLSQSACS